MWLLESKLAVIFTVRRTFFIAMSTEIELTLKWIAKRPLTGVFVDINELQLKRHRRDDIISITVRRFVGDNFVILF